MEDNQEPSILDTETTSERKNSATNPVKRKGPPLSEGVEEKVISVVHKSWYA